ncbi:unnamed protein product [Owenia fusiformis]|uniref:Uncharacterized protein n=1 Tax=Owenia fusiformis TaxID=6347 RepID=A0A8J1TUF0_OWEFU|nr:unnamed protein product [Owenia fusiformis]
MYSNYSKTVDMSVAKNQAETYLTSPFWFRKMVTYFRRLDIDNDGTITIEEWMELIKRFQAKQNDKKSEDRVKETLMRMWKEFMGSTKESMSLHDWLLCAVEIPLQRKNNGMSQLITDFSRVFFQTLDTNNDQEISMEEFENFFDCFQINPNFTPIAFKLIDTNEDGSISFNEFRHSLKDFFVNLDENSKGKCFFGPLIYDQVEAHKHKKEDYLASSYWQRKMKTYFSRLDADGDGEVTLDEWNMVIQRFSEICCHERKNAITSSLMKMWLVYKGGSKKSLTLDEWMTKCALGPSTSHRLDTNTLYRRFAQIYFKAIDLDGDGVISQAEHEAFFKCLGIDQKWSKEAFDSLDINKDGAISFQEFCDGFLEFFFNLDEKRNHGDLFFGPLL